MPFTRATAQRPVPDDALSEVEFHAWRVLGSHDAATARRLENGHAVFAVRMTGYDHQGSYKDTHVKHATLYAVLRMGANAKELPCA